MSYLTSIPNPSDFLAVSQKQLQVNYQQIYNSFSTNHIALDSIAKNLGYHTSLTMPAQNSDPTTSATEVAFYNKIVSSVPQVFYRPAGSGTPIQMTNSNSSLIKDATQDRNTTFLPGPFTLYTGYLINPTSGTIVTLLPSTTLIYVGINLLGDANIGSAKDVSGNQFTLFFSGNPPLTPHAVYYMAIGSP